MLGSHAFLKQRSRLRQPHKAAPPRSLILAARVNSEAIVIQAACPGCWPSVGGSPATAGCPISWEAAEGGGGSSGSQGRQQVGGQQRGSSARCAELASVFAAFEPQGHAAAAVSCSVALDVHVARRSSAGACSAHYPAWMPSAERR